MLEVRGKIGNRVGDPRIFVEVLTYFGPFRQAVLIDSTGFTTNRFLLGISSISEIANISITTESSEQEIRECVQIYEISWHFLYPPDETYEINRLQESFSLSPDPTRAPENCEAKTNRLSILDHYYK